MRPFINLARVGVNSDADFLFMVRSFFVVRPVQNDWALLQMRPLKLRQGQSFSLSFSLTCILGSVNYTFYKFRVNKYINGESNFKQKI